MAALFRASCLSLANISLALLQNKRPDIPSWVDAQAYRQRNDKALDAFAVDLVVLSAKAPSRAIMSCAGMYSTESALAPVSALSSPSNYEALAPQLVSAQGHPSLSPPMLLVPSAPLMSLTNSQPSSTDSSAQGNWSHPLGAPDYRGPAADCSQQSYATVGIPPAGVIHFEGVRVDGASAFPHDASVSRQC
jgi:hypothetical protein